jgi:hypothetical protein
MNTQRRLVKSGKEHIGLAPALSQPGGGISVLLGCIRPGILRKHGGSYVFIGPAYVYTIKRGNVMSASEDKPSFQEFSC